MNLQNGFQLDEPAVLVPWSITEAELQELLANSKLHKVTGGYYTLDCRPLGGLAHTIGFHFRDDVIGLFEFFQKGENVKSFSEFQTHLEMTFGAPTQCRAGTEGFNDYRWLIDGFEIIHTVQERFGPEERLSISPIR